MATCTVEPCSKPVIARSWCSAHYQEWRKHGRVTPRLDILGRMDALVDVSSPGCWIWQGTLDDHGYGRIWHQGRWCLVHRLSYELRVGPIPEGLEIDHLCRIPACSNPGHLEPVTHAVNMSRSISRTAGIAECLYGHPFDDANTYHYRGKRECRACRREATARYERRRKGR